MPAYLLGTMTADALSAKYAVRVLTGFPLQASARVPVHFPFSTLTPAGRSSLAWLSRTKRSVSLAVHASPNAAPSQLAVPQPVAP